MLEDTASRFKNWTFLKVLFCSLFQVRTKLSQNNNTTRACTCLLWSIMAVNLFRWGRSRLKATTQASALSKSRWVETTKASLRRLRPCKNIRELPLESSYLIKTGSINRACGTHWSQISATIKLTKKAQSHPRTRVTSSNLSNKFWTWSTNPKNRLKRATIEDQLARETMPLTSFRRQTSVQ